MKVELHRNGEIQILLKAEDSLEHEFLFQIMTRTNNGATVRVRGIASTTTSDLDDQLVVAVEK